MISKQSFVLEKGKKEKERKQGKNNLKNQVPLKKENYVLTNRIGWG